MIVLDLRCAAGHVTEGWFSSAEDLSDQQGRGLVSCPICGSGAVERMPAAPRLSTKGAPAAGDAKAALAALAKVQRSMLAGSEDVGTHFAETARAIHLGEAECRAIHGQASLSDARALAEEGVRFAPLPLPIRSSRDN